MATLPLPWTWKPTLERPLSLCMVVRRSKAGVARRLAGAVSAQLVYARERGSVRIGTSGVETQFEAWHAAGRSTLGPAAADTIGFGRHPAAAGSDVKWRDKWDVPVCSAKPAKR